MDTTESEREDEMEGVDGSEIAEENNRETTPVASRTYNSDDEDAEQTMMATSSRAAAKEPRRLSAYHPAASSENLSALFHAHRHTAPLDDGSDDEEEEDAGIEQDESTSGTQVEDLLPAATTSQVLSDHQPLRKTKSAANLKSTAVSESDVPPMSRARGLPSRPVPTGSAREGDVSSTQDKPRSVSAHATVDNVEQQNRLSSLNSDIQGKLSTRPHPPNGTTGATSTAPKKRLILPSSSSSGGLTDADLALLASSGSALADLTSNASLMGWPTTPQVGSRGMGIAGRGGVSKSGRGGVTALSKISSASSKGIGGVARSGGAFKPTPFAAGQSSGVRGGMSSSTSMNKGGEQSGSGL